jgi:co-chaperonin GroES (HSP10)
MSKKINYPKAPKDRIILEFLDETEQVGSVVIPEKWRAPYGRSRAGAPHKAGRVVSVGPDVKENIKIGDKVLVDGMNASPFEHEERKYLSVVPKAALLVFEDE